MPRAVIYARYSSELQRDASIEDQVRLCKARIANEKWSPAGVYTDHAMSGSIRMRPGYQKLLEDAWAGEFDVVVAEALDRLSRDQEDVASLYKHLSFSNVKLITIAEGEIAELHVGFKGTMNAIFLKDLRQKVRRGLEGRVRAQRSGGGLGYGYVVVREYDARGEPIRGKRKINEVESAVTRRIFSEFVSGKSPRAIAKTLNAEGVIGPFGKTWGPSTIYGNWRRGTGILNNELYIGRLVWNRQRFIKDPTTGRRLGRVNPASEWIVENMEELRIIDSELWQSVKERQKVVRASIAFGNDHTQPEKARRPAYLLSTLLRCGECGGGFSKRSEHHYGCSNARNRGTCSNRITIRRDILEASVLNGLKTHLMHPDLVKEFAAEYHRELNRLQANWDYESTAKREELVRVERQISAIIDAIKEGIRTASMRDELMALETKKELLQTVVKQPRPSAARLHPGLAEVYRKKVERLRDELNRDELRSEATEVLRCLIEEIRLHPENGRLEIELIGSLAEILAFANGTPRRIAPTGVQITMVAGEGCQRKSHLLRIEI
jgi:site-specific DNA recombinase